MGRRADRHLLRWFVYVSDAKLANLLDEINDRTRRSILEKLQVSLGFNLAPVNLTVQSQPANKSLRNRSRAVQVSMVEEYVRQQFKVGDLATGDHWIAGRVDMEWAPLQDGETVLFCGYAGPLLVALNGSVGHLIGQTSSGNRTGSHSYAIRAAVLNGDALESLGDDLVVAARAMNFAPQPVRFLAQVIRRGKVAGDGPQREFVLATPLYVEDAHRADESGDVTVRGTVAWFSGDRGWGLIAPDGTEDAVVVDASAIQVADGPVLTAGQRAEFRVTHGATGIQATSLRPLRIPPGEAGPDSVAVTGGHPLGPEDPGRIDRYEVLRRLGEGSMGVVYLARGEDEGLVAIKVIRPEYTRDPVFLRRFQTEGDHARRVRAPNVARVIATVTDTKLPYLVTDFIDGPTLEERVERHGPLPVRSAIDVSRGVAAALDAIHKAGIVHRDLTPSNIILSDSGPRVIDFGIAHTLGSDTRHTQAGRPIGTPAYMSPEQITEETLTPTSDIFSWAALTVFAVTGHQPFASRDSPVTTVWREITDGTPNLNGVPGQLRDVVASALNKEPRRRPTAAQLLERLSVSPPPHRPDQRTRPRGWLPIAKRMPQSRVHLAAGAAAVAAVIALLVVFLSPLSPGRPMPSPNAASPSTRQPTGGIGIGAAEPVNAVILADESNSMQEYHNELTGEQQAVTQIVQEEWSPRSQIAIYGFGSVPEERGAPYQTAIDQYCGPTELTGDVALAKLTRCASEIKPRTEAQGSDTDFAAALNEALAVLGTRQAVSRLPLVFILTDGQLDVGPDSPYSGWGSSDAAGNAAARSLITNPSTGILHKLRSLGAEIWPVGFGQADTSELSLFARGGAQNDCPAGSGTTPEAVLVPPAVTGSAETEDIQSKLVAAFAEARCAAIGQSASAQLLGGDSFQQTVAISPLATLASLVVDKGDPRVEVTYTDPLGQKISDTEPSPGSIDGGSYQLTSSSQSPLETLRLDNPYPGSWKVTFTDPPGVPATVGLSVAWQGEVQLEFVNQQVGDPGHPYRLVVQPAVRSAPVPASALAGLRAEFAVTWPGGQVTRAEAALDAAGDFTATVLVPQVLQGLNGIARVTATAAAPSVQGQALGAFPVTPDGGITVNLNLRPGTTVVPGGTVTAIATVDSGQSRASIVFSLAGLGNGVDATLTQPSGAVAYGPGTSSFPVTITFSPDTRSGPALGTILWAPAGQGTLAPSDWLAIAPLDVDIAYQATTPFWLLWWFWPVIVAVVAACASLGFRRRDSRERIK